MKRRKYNYGTSAKIETPSEALAQNEINIAKSQLDSMQNPLIQTTKMLGQLGQMATAGVIPGGEYLQALQQFGQLMAYGGAVKKYAMGGEVPVEVEGDEVAKTPDGDMLEFKGKKHEEGGIKTNLPEGTEVYSDRIKIEGKTLAKRKTEREKHMMKLQKMLTETFDPLLEKTTLRVKNNNDKIEAFDKKVQGVANEAEKAKQEEERARKIQKQKEEERLRREEEQKEGVQEGEQDPEKESLENREDDSEQETKRIGDKPQGNESDENEDQQQQNEDQPSEGLPKFKYGSFPGDPLALDPSLITNNTLDILGSFQPQSYTPNNPNNYSPIVSNNFEATPFSASENILTDFLELSNSSINNPIISRNPINAPKNTLEERLSKQSKKEDAKNFLKTIGKESLPDLTTGDAMGLAASLAQSFLPLKNTLEERATDRVNENLYQNYGESALRDMEDAQGMLQASFKDQADRLARSKRTQKSQNALSARGISQKRAMNLASEQQFQDSFNQAYSAFNQQLMSMVQGKARFKAEVDQIRTQGAEKADIANRQDKANFYTQRGQDLMSMTEGLQNVAKNLNEAEYRESMEYMLNTLYDKYGIEIDMKGNLGVNKSKTKTPE